MESSSYQVKLYKSRDNVCWRKIKAKPDLSAIMQVDLLDEKNAESGIKMEWDFRVIKSKHTEQVSKFCFSKTKKIVPWVQYILKDHIGLSFQMFPIMLFCQGSSFIVH